MALLGLVRKAAMLPSSGVLPLTSIMSMTPLLKCTPLLYLTPLRTYMDNFNNERTHIKPVLGWMHENRVRQGYRSAKSRREYIASYSEAKRIRSFGWEKRMSTEGGRKIIMRRILRGKDHLAQ
eukprot:GFUD01034686.1.p1 GENE.GFUD01034686.1~~GFUD01034686.1.p1  ORF type:complete len:123 (+),score=26.42 GFUD01034686.1:55-423(+)